VKNFYYIGQITHPEASSTFNISDVLIDRAGTSTIMPIDVVKLLKLKPRPLEPRPITDINGK